MSRQHPVLSLAVVLGLGALLVPAAGCGGDSKEQDLKEATAAVVENRESVQEARKEVDALQQVVDDAQKKLDAAKSELRDREKTLREAESRVDREATDVTLFRTVQKRLLDDEQLEDVAVEVRVAKGVVTLQGTVPDEEARARAEKIARETPGVVTIENQIEVASPPAEK